MIASGHPEEATLQYVHKAPTRSTDRMYDIRTLYTAFGLVLDPSSYVSYVVHLVALEVVVEHHARPEAAQHEYHAHDRSQQPELHENDRHLSELLPGEDDQRKKKSDGRPRYDAKRGSQRERLGQDGDYAHSVAREQYRLRITDIRTEKRRGRTTPTDCCIDILVVTHSKITLPRKHGGYFAGLLYQPFREIMWIFDIWYLVSTPRLGHDFHRNNTSINT